MKVIKYFNDPNLARDLIKLNSLLDQAQEDVSIFGKKIIKIQGYEGSISLNEVTLKALEISKQRCQADDLTTQERLAGIEILNKLERLAKSNTNVLKRIVCVIRSFFTFYPPQFFIGEGKNNFSAYSPDKFKQEFGEIIPAENSFNSLTDDGNSKISMQHSTLQTSDNQTDVHPARITKFRYVYDAEGAILNALGAIGTVDTKVPVDPDWKCRVWRIIATQNAIYNKLENIEGYKLQLDFKDGSIKIVDF